MNLFHPNRLETDLFSYEIGKGMRVRCQVAEEWEPVLRRPVRCGAKFQHKLRLKQGCSNSELRSFEETIKAGLGIEGFGSFQGTIKHQAQKSITFTEETEQEHQLEFQAPACGFYHISLFQRIRHFTFEFFRPKFFGGETTWHTSISKRLPEYHDDSTLEPNDPSCNCPPPREDPDLEKNPARILILSDNFSFTTLCHEVPDSMGAPAGRVYIPALSISLRGPLSRLHKLRLTLWTNRFPRHLIQLANITSKTIDFEISPAIQESLIELESRFGLKHQQLRELYPIYFDSIEQPTTRDVEVVSVEDVSIVGCDSNDTQTPLAGGV